MRSRAFIDHPPIVSCGSGVDAGLECVFQCSQLGFKAGIHDAQFAFKEAGSAFEARVGHDIKKAGPTGCGLQHGRQGRFYGVRVGRGHAHGDVLLVAHGRQGCAHDAYDAFPRCPGRR